MNIPERIWMLGAAALFAVVLGVFGFIDGAKLAGWLETIYTDATGAE